MLRNLFLTPILHTPEPWVLNVEGNSTLVHGDSGPSNVQLTNTCGLSTLLGRNVMVSYDGLGSRRTRDIACTNSFRAERSQKASSQCLKAHAERRRVKFGSKGSWIDLHTDSGVQSVPVRVRQGLWPLEPEDQCLDHP